MLVNDRSAHVDLQVQKVDIRPFETRQLAASQPRDHVGEDQDSHPQMKRCNQLLHFINKV